MGAWIFGGQLAISATLLYKINKIDNDYIDPSEQRFYPATQETGYIIKQS